jgi:hypothetical protein
MGGQEPRRYKAPSRNSARGLGICWRARHDSRASSACQAHSSRSDFANVRPPAPQADRMSRDHSGIG